MLDCDLMVGFIAGLEVLRQAVGAGVNTGRQPESVTSYDPREHERLKNGDGHQKLGYTEPRVL